MPYYIQKEEYSCNIYLVWFTFSADRMFFVTSIDRVVYC